MKRLHRFLIIKLSDDGTHAELEHFGARTATFADFKSLMPTDQPRIAVYDLEFEKDTRHESKLLFIMYSPDNCKNMQLRFTYSTNKDPIKQKVSSVHKELQINDTADLNEAEWISDF
jgi:hypothetical protein